jgi:hypothetical protein
MNPWQAQRIGELALGALIVASVLFDVFQSVVVPRWTPRQLRLAPMLVDGLWWVWRGVGRRLRPAERREDFLGAFAPLALVVTLLVWTGALIFGYGLALYAMRHEVRPPLPDLGTACYLAGVAVFTLGFGDIVPTSGGARVLTLAASASGLAVVALVISLLFNLHAAFQRREVQVIALDARAGAPPSGVRLLVTYAEHAMLADLPALFASWEIWAADVLESHRAYPLLPFYRSSHQNESWVSALGAVLDAATLLMTTTEDIPHGAAVMMQRVGVHAVSDLNDWCGQRCGDEVGISRADWTTARDQLGEAGLSLREPESSWRAFAEARREYAGPLNALAGHFAISAAGWLGDPTASEYARHSRQERSGSMSQCTHLDQVHQVAPSAQGCEECLATGDRWVHLRLCRICGHVGCCDSSKNKHATKHFQATGHPIIQSFEPGEDWGWCYVDELMLEMAPGG